MDVFSPETRAFVKDVVGAMIPTGDQRMAAALALVSADDTERAIRAMPDVAPEIIAKLDAVEGHEREQLLKGVAVALAQNPKRPLGRVFLPVLAGAPVRPETRVGVDAEAFVMRTHRVMFTHHEELLAMLPLPKQPVDTPNGRIPGLSDFARTPKREDFRTQEEFEKAAEAPGYIAAMLQQLPLLDVPILGTGRLAMLLMNTPMSRHTSAFSRMHMYHGVLRMLHLLVPWRRRHGPEDSETLSEDDAVKRTATYMRGAYMHGRVRIVSSMFGRLADLLRRYPPVEGEEPEVLVLSKTTSVRYSLRTVAADRRAFLADLLEANRVTCVSLIRHMEFTIMTLLQDFIVPAVRMERLTPPRDGAADSAAPVPDWVEIMYTPFTPVPPELLRSAHIRSMAAQVVGDIAIRQARRGLPQDVKPPPGEEDFAVAPWVSAWQLWTHFRSWLCMTEQETNEMLHGRFMTAVLSPEIIERIKETMGGDPADREVSDAINELHVYWYLYWVGGSSVPSHCARVMAATLAGIAASTCTGSAP